MIKMEKNLKKYIYLTYYSLLIAQHLRQVHHQIFLIIFPKQFIVLNENLGTMIKSVKHVELNINF